MDGSGSPSGIVQGVSIRITLVLAFLNNTSTELIQYFFTFLDNNEILEIKKKSIECENDSMKYACMVCDFKCMRKNELQIHKVEKHQLKCDHCNSESFKVSQLEEHMNTDHEMRI